MTEQIKEQGKGRCRKYLEEVENHLFKEMIPFWLTHGVDKEYGGFLTYLDRNGNPTGVTDKTMLCQARVIYTYSSLHRAGLCDGQTLPIAKQGVDFLLKHFWDKEHGGWFWTSKQDGTPINMSKLTYGHSFVIYGLSEYGMASGDPRGLEWAIKTYDMLQTMAADNCWGGYYEFLERDWSKKKPGKYGGDRKSYDTHMHLMEAYTTFAEATGSRIHKERLLEIIELLCRRILHPKFRTGVAQFAYDWTPLRQILFADVWGSDRDVDEGARPMNNTSFGHNVEFGWLLLHACRVHGIDVTPYKDTLKLIFDHAVKYGIDWEHGGVYCEGPHDGPARERNKEFWQQAECLVGFLDAYRLFGDPKYLDAYENIHRFVMDHMINHAVGEWFPLFDQNSKLLWDYMGHAWKTNYHTVRSMVQCRERLKSIMGE